MNKEIFQDPGFHPELARGEDIRLSSVEAPAESVEGLTIRPQTLYSGKEGLIFNMEGEIGEVSKLPQAPETTPSITPQGKLHTPEEKTQIAEVGKALEGIAGAPPEEFQKAVEENLPSEEKQKREKIVGKRKREKLTPDVEPTLQLDQDSFTDPILGPIVSQLNEQLERRRIDLDFIRRQIMRVEGLQDQGRVNPDQAREILNNLEGWRIQASLGEEPEITGGWYGARVLTDIGVNRIRTDPEFAERHFNRMFIRVDAQPREEFSKAFGTIGEVEFNDLINALTKALESPEVRVDPEYRDRIQEMITRYSHEKDIRELFHNAHYALLANLPSERFVDFFHGRFTSDMADSAYRTEGVTPAAHFYEQALRQVIDENDGYLPADEVGIDPSASKVTGREGRVEILTREYFDEALKNGLVKTIIRGTGKDDQIEERRIAYSEIAEERIRESSHEYEGLSRDEAFQRALEEVFPRWKRNRAISLARGAGIVTMRTIEILSDVKLPKEADGLPSLYGQDIVRDLVPYRHLFGKFGIGIERLAVLAYKIRSGEIVWSQEELLRFLSADKEKLINGELPELGELYIQRANPYESGGIYSHTSWRVTAAIDHMTVEEKEWMGTGVRLERLRSAFRKEKEQNLPEDKRPVKAQMVRILKKMTEIQPLRLYRQMPQLGMQAERDEIIRSICNFSKSEDGSKDELKQLRRLRDLKARLRAEFDPQDKEVFKKRKEWGEELQQLLPLEDALLEKEKVLTRVEMDLALVQERTIQEGIQSQKEEDQTKRIKFEDAKLAFNSIPEEGGRRANVERLAGAIKEKFLRNKEAPLKDLAEKIGRDDWPFVLGTDDVPYDEYRFVKTGPTGLARTLRDFLGATKASAGTIKLVRRMDSYQKIEDIVNDLREGIYENVSLYDEEKARRVILELAEGIAKFYGKDWWARLPFGIGSGLGFLGARGLLPYEVEDTKTVELKVGRFKLGELKLPKFKTMKSSYAETVFGTEAMAWNERDKWNFTKALQAAGMLNYKQVGELRKRIGATRKHLTWYYTRTYTPLGIGFFLYELWKEFTKDLGRDLTR